MSIGTKLYTWFFGKLVGIDNLNNKYYCSSNNFNNHKVKRWVIFSKEIEATRIPPHWHAWLHKTIDLPPIDYKHKYNWQKDLKPNMTGTSEAYYPDSHPLSQSQDKKIKKDYETWNP